MIDVEERASIVRAGRYVSAPAGMYPAPVPARSRAASREAASASAGTPAVDPAATVALSLEAARAAAAGLGPDSPAEALPPLVDAAAPAKSAGVPPGVMPEERSSRTGRGRVLLGRLFGAGVGAVAGSTIGLSLVALASGGPFMERMREPVRLWQSIDDPVLITSVCLVAAGFVLLGFSSGGRGASRPR